jgi:class 3 adenylate cyclase
VDEVATRYAVTREGVHIAYQVFGDGPETVVASPDPPTSLHVIWEDPPTAAFLRRLGSFTRIVLFDRRGTGASDPVPAAEFPAPDELMDDLSVVMDATHVDRATLWGLQDAGAIALQFAASYPDRVARLILLNSFARMTRTHDYPIGMPNRLQQTFLSAIETGWSEGVGIELLAAPRAHEPDFRRWFTRASTVTQGPAMARANLQRAFKLDVRAVLPHVQVPTLVLHTGGNPYMRAAHGQYLAEHLPDARFVELSGAGHVLPSLDLDEVLGHLEEFMTGTRSSDHGNRVFATILFSDIVESTERASRAGDRQWTELLDEHDRVVRRQLDRFGGRLVKTTGDGVLATFDRPARAVQSAVAIREAVSRIGLAIRIGLHAGEVEQRGSDIGGIAVHIAARVQAHAHPGEVLVSRTVADLVVGSALTFEDRGLHELKGVDGAWTLLAAV